jgi:hypothetical protein
MDAARIQHQRSQDGASHQNDYNFTTIALDTTMRLDPVKSSSSTDSLIRRQRTKLMDIRFSWILTLMNTFARRRYQNWGRSIDP